MLTSINGCKSTDDDITKTIAINNFDADRNGKTNDPGINTANKGSDSTACNNGGLNSNDNLFMLCQCWYNIGGADKDINDNCKTQVCGCST
jgi:hypothetical protein